MSSTSARPRVVSARKQSGASARPENAGIANLKERLEADLRAAMKSGDAARRDALRFVLAAVHNEQVARNKGALDDVAVLDVLQKQAKMRRDSIDAFTKGERPELAAKEQGELALIQTYLPAQMSEAEVRAIAERVVRETGASGPREMGKVMPKVMAETKDRADGKAVAAIVAGLLKEKSPS